LITQICTRYQVPVQAGLKEDEREKMVRLIQLRVINVIKHWLEHHYADFNHELNEQVTNFVDNLPSYFDKTAKSIQQAIINRVAMPHTYSPDSSELRDEGRKPTKKGFEEARIS
jgi:hypothetical protein